MRLNKQVLRYLLSLGLLFLLACKLDAFAGNVLPVASQEPDWSQGRLVVSNPEGESVYARGYFRIIYHTRGEHAVPEEDRNNNGIPDFVEDLALQLVVARHIFLNLSGFPDPLDSSRYAGVKFVDVYVLAPAEQQKGKGATYQTPRSTLRNGAAYQTPRPAHAPAPPGALALRIDIARHIDCSSNAAPTHEYFHLIQNGVTQLTNRWYYEGMAAWSQDALNKSAQVESDWQNIDRLLYAHEGMEFLFKSAYRGNRILWTPLAELCDPEGGILPEEDPFLRSTYSNGLQVLKDFRFRGARIMRQVLQRFAAVQHILYELYGNTDWDRPQRTDTRNNAYMLEEVRTVVKAMCPPH